MKLESGEAQAVTGADIGVEVLDTDLDAVGLLEQVDEPAVEPKKAEPKVDEPVSGDDDVSDDDLEAAEEADKAGDKADDEREDIPADVQEKIDRRIGKEVRKRKELEERLAVRDAEVERLRTLEAEVGSLREQASSALPVHSAYVSAEDRKLFAEADSVEREKSWLMKHIDGFEADDPAKSLSAEQVRERLSRVDMRLGVVERANSRYEALRKDMIGDIERFRGLRAGYETVDALEADLRLAQAVRKKRTAVAAKAKGSSEQAEPVAASGSSRALMGRASAESGDKKGFNARRFLSSEMTTEDLVASGF